VTLVSSGAAMARRVEHALASRDLENHQDREGDYAFLCTGDPEAFRTVGTRFLQMPLGEVRQVSVEKVAAGAAR
jgi:glutamate racemase